MNNSGNTFLGILAGTAIGATLGILFAPDKGSNTRKMLADKANETKDHLAESAMDLKDNISESVSNKNASFDERFDAVVSDASYKAEDVITSLENKLEQLKLKNKKYQQEQKLADSKA